MADIHIYWEDLQVGQVRQLGQIKPTREDIIAFAKQFDPQPFQLDDEAAKASVCRRKASMIRGGVAWRGSPIPRLIGDQFGLGVTSENKTRKRSNG